MSSKKARQKFFNKTDDIQQVLDEMFLVYQNDFSRVNPWLITAGQLDDDKAIELFVGAYRPTYYYEDNTRPYFLEYKNKIVVRQWTGSYLDNQCFSDGYFADQDLDGISTLFLDETVLNKGVLKNQQGEFTIIGFNPIRIKP